MILSSSLIALLDTIEAIEKGMSFDPGLGSRKVLGIDIEIRSHNRQAFFFSPAGFTSRAIGRFFRNLSSY